MPPSMKSIYRGLILFAVVLVAAVFLGQLLADILAGFILHAIGLY